MRSSFVVLILMISSLVACSSKKDDPKNNDTPQLTEGYYAGTVENRNVPAVSIQMKDGKIYTYGLLWYECENTIYGEYHRTSTHFGASASSAGGPTVSHLGKKCDIETEITANENFSLKIKVKINGTAQDEYILTKVTSDDLVNTIRSIQLKSDTFSIEEEACKENFDKSCVELDLRNK